MGAIVALMAALAAQSTSPPNATTDAASDPTKPKTGHITYVDLDASAGYSTNAETSLSSNSGAATGAISIHAVHTRITDRTSTLLSAFGQATGYTGHQSSAESLSITVGHDAAVNERLNLFVHADATYDQNGQLDTRIISVPDVPPLPGSPNLPPQILPPGSDFLSLSGKHYYLSAETGGSLALSAFDSLNFSSGVSRSIFHDPGFPDSSDYWAIPASVGYQRRLSTRASAGAVVSFDYTDYNGGANFTGPSKFWTATPQITGTLQLSERMIFTGGIGFSYSSVEDRFQTRRSTSLAANANLCDRGEMSHICARASIGQETATVAGPAKTMSAGIDYSRDLDANSSLMLALDTSHYAEPISFITGLNFSSSTYFRAAAGYTRRFGHRLFGGLNVSARKVVQQGPDPKADFTGSLFIRYRFGDVQ